MATIKVLPAGDEMGIRGNWRVTKNGRHLKGHTKKSAAKRTARRESDSGDLVEIRRVDGSIQDRRVVR